MTAAYSNEACALESPGPGGSLQWKEHMSGHWSAKGLGGRYDIYPAGTGGYKAYWEQSGTGTQHPLGSYDTIGAAFGACRRHADSERRQTSAAEEDGVAKDVARKAAASAYGAGQIETVTGSGNRFTVTLKNGKRVHVAVDGSTGTVTDPDDGHVVATHTVSEAAESKRLHWVLGPNRQALMSDGVKYQYWIIKSKRSGGYELWLHTSDGSQRKIGKGNSVESLKEEASGYESDASEAGECGCPHSHPKSVPTKPCAGERTWTATLQAIRDKSNSAGLSYVPAVIREMINRHDFTVKDAKEAILQAERDDLISLYPDAGFGRLSPADKKLTITGPEGTHLAYAKIRHGASETVPVIHEANDAGSFATIDRDPKEFAKGKALGKANTPVKAYKIVRKSLEKESQEVFLVLPMDLHGELLSRPVEVARGQRDRVAVGTSDVLRPANVTNAKGFVVVHNHPSGHAKPSPKDRELTKAIRKDTPSDLHFLDHLVVGHNSFYSFAENEPELFK